MRLAREAFGAPEGELALDAADEALLCALLEAYPDRLARRRADAPGRGVLAGGRGVRLAPSSGVLTGELFLALELDAGQGEAWVRQASLVERAWLDPAHVVSEEQAVFDADQERVVARRRLSYRGLVLEEREGGSLAPERVERALVEAARADLFRALDLGRPEIAGFRERLACLAQWMPELKLAPWSDAEIAELLPELARGARSFADLSRAPLLAHLRGRLTHAQAQALEREAPERLQVPSGSQIRLTYALGRAPVLAARIQELFGLRATPRIAGGRVGVLPHLLAPNGRPEQITDDLASFWSKTYFDVKKELRRRYPRHAWPDDPTSAPPERRPGRRS